MKGENDKGCEPTKPPCESHDDSFLDLLEKT